MKEYQQQKRRVPRFIVGLLCCFVFLQPLGAMGEFSPWLETRQAEYRQGKSLGALLTVRFDKLSALSTKALKAVNDKLTETALCIETGPEAVSLVLTVQDKENLRLQTVNRDGVIYLQAGEDVLREADTLYPGMRTADNLGLIDPAAAAVQMKDWLSGLEGAVLSAVPAKEIRDGVYYSCAGKIHVTRRRTVPAEDMNVAVRGAMDTFPYISGTEVFLQKMAAMQFYKPVTLNMSNSNDLSVFVMEMDAPGAVWEGKNASVSLTLGFGSTGTLFSVVYKPEDSSTYLKMSVKMRLETDNNSHTLAGEISVDRRVNGARTRISGEWDLKNTLSAEKERLTGKAIWTVNRGKQDSNWQIRPDVVFAGDMGTGEISLVHKTGDTSDIRATLGVQMYTVQGTAMDIAQAVPPDLNGAYKVQRYLTQSFARIMSGFDKEDMYLITHEISGDQAFVMDAEVQDDDDFAVVD